MAFIFPFNTDKFTAYADAKETTTTKLSLAVLVRNGANDQFITSGIKVSLLGDKAYQPIQNLSGYYCFTDMSPGKFKLIVQSNRLKGDQFFNEEVPVDIPLINELAPVQEIILTPKPSYLFSANATLIRGMVSRKTISPAIKGNPVVGATVRPRYQGEQVDPKIIMETRTDDAGEFVLLVKQIKFENDIAKKDIKNIAIDIDKDNQSITIETNDLLNKKPFLEGETGVVVINDFPAI